MNFYNLIFGYGDKYQIELVLGFLQLTRDDFGRFRDAGIDRDGMWVYTRLGGGNREYYQETIDKIRSHHLYLSDKDDDFDSTYCTFRFKFPDLFPETDAATKDTFDPDQRWLNVILRVASGEVSEDLKEIVREIFKEVENDLSDEPE